MEDETSGEASGADLAIEVAMLYERSQSWTPYDVSRDDDHHEVRFEGPNRQRHYIEVHGRAQSGAVDLTGPEVDEQRHLAEHTWLSPVAEGKRPQLRSIQEPLLKPRPGVPCRQVQDLVHERE